MDKWMHPGLKEKELKRASKALFTQNIWKRQSGSKASQRTQKIDQTPDYVNRVFQETEFARLEHIKKGKQNPANNMMRNNFFVVDTENKKKSTTFFSEEDISIFNMRKPSKKVEQQTHELDDMFVYREGMYLTKEQMDEMFEYSLKHGLPQDAHTNRYMFLYRKMQAKIKPFRNPNGTKVFHTIYDLKEVLGRFKKLLHKANQRARFEMEKNNEFSSNEHESEHSKSDWTEDDGNEPKTPNSDRKRVNRSPLRSMSPERQKMFISVEQSITNKRLMMNKNIVADKFAIALMQGVIDTEKERDYSYCTPSLNSPVSSETDKQKKAESIRNVQSIVSSEIPDKFRRASLSISKNYGLFKDGQVIALNNLALTFKQSRKLVEKMSSFGIKVSKRIEDPVLRACKAAAKKCKHSKNNEQVYATSSKKLQFFSEAKHQNPNTMKKSNFTGQFLKVCQEANITPLPINTKIENNQLKLFRYHMSDQIAQALSMRLEQVGFYFLKLIQNEHMTTADLQAQICEFEADVVTALSLQENGLKDKSFCQILKGISCQQTLKSLSYCDNEIGQSSVDMLVNLIKNQPLEVFNQDLHELRFSNVKGLTFDMARQLLEALIFARAARKVRFCQVPLSKTTFNCGKLLQNLIIDCPRLIELDLTQTQLGIKALLEIVQVLPDKKIQNLNLSKNSIHIKKPDYPSVKPTESELQFEEFIEKLSAWIATSENLVHLNLSSMNLGEHVLRLADSFNASKTLVAIHLSDNQTAESIELLLCSKLKINKQKITAEKLANDQRRMTFPFDVLEQERTNESDGEDVLGARQANIVKNTLFKKIKIQQHQLQVDQQTNKAIGPSMESAVTGNSMPQTSSLIFTRVLGQLEQAADVLSNKNTVQQLLPDVQQWQLNQDEICAHCEGWNYVLIFYKRAFRSNEFTPILNKTTVRQLKQTFFQEEYCAECPMLLSSFTNWQVQRMQALRDFTFKADPAELKVQLALAEKLEQVLKSEAEEAEKLLMFSECLKSKGKAIKETSTTQNWRNAFAECFQHLKSATLINYPQWLSNDYNGKEELDVFVYIGLVPPGKHTIIVRDPINDQFYMKKIVVATKMADEKPNPKNDNFEKLGFKMLQRPPKIKRKHNLMQNTNLINKIGVPIEQQTTVYPHLLSKKCASNDAVCKASHFFPCSQMNELLSSFEIVGTEVLTKIELWCNVAKRNQELKVSEMSEKERKQLEKAGIDPTSVEQPVVVDKTSKLDVRLLKLFADPLQKVFTIRSSCSSFPYVSKKDFKRFIFELGLPTKELDFDSMFEKIKPPPAPEPKGKKKIVVKYIPPYIDPFYALFDLILIAAETLFLVEIGRKPSEMPEKLAFTSNAALEILLRKYLYPLAAQTLWQEQRSLFTWSPYLNEILDLNAKNLWQVFQKYQENGKFNAWSLLKFMEKVNFGDLMGFEMLSSFEQASLQLKKQPVKQNIYLKEEVVIKTEPFFAKRTTVTKPSENGLRQEPSELQKLSELVETNQTELTFVEFLEFVTRLSIYAFGLPISEHYNETQNAKVYIGILAVCEAHNLTAIQPKHTKMAVQKELLQDTCEYYYSDSSIDSQEEEQLFQQFMEFETVSDDLVSTQYLQHREFLNQQAPLVIPDGEPKPPLPPAKPTKGKKGKKGKGKK